MATDGLAAEIATHRVRDTTRGPSCCACWFPWPCLVRRLADERDRLRAALAFVNSMMLSGESYTERSRQVVRDALAPPAEPDAGAGRR